MLPLGHELYVHRVAPSSKAGGAVMARRRSCSLVEFLIAGFDISRFGI